MAGDPEPYFRSHVFVCTNEREDNHPRGCCAGRGSIALRDYMKQAARELGLEGVRINAAGCLDRCELGPTMVIYPEGVWYGVASESDIDEVLETHLGGGGRVPHLMLAPHHKKPADRDRALLHLIVGGVTDTAPNIQAFDLVDPKGAELPAFTGGGHIEILLEDGRRRAFSLAGDPADRKRYRIGIAKSGTPGSGGDWLYDNLEPGTPVSVLEPRNAFPIAKAGAHIFIAGGIGVTPLLSMGYALARDGADFRMYYCTRSLEETPFRAEVDTVFADRLILHHDGGDAAKSLDLDRVLAARPDGAHLYLCGPAGMVGAAVAAAKAADWPDDAVHYEPHVLAQAKKST